MYAVIELQGHQYIVSEGDNILVDKIDSKTGEKINVENVLSVFDEKGEKVSVGSPYLNAKVSLEVVENKRGKKITVIKFKRKNRYKRSIGFKPYQTVLTVKKIEFNG